MLKKFASVLKGYGSGQGSDCKSLIFGQP